jgi:sterol desaturase/sphingolipid hydroxylase (fatty acid hydroxylase superfamily)
LRVDAEPWIRLGAFAGVLAVLAAWEIVAPARVPTIGRKLRWPGNLGVFAIDVLLVRFFLPTAAVGFAIVTETRGWGLFGRLDLALWFEVAATIVVLDLVIYAQHAIFHRVPLLWRLHRMHHADLELDVTTGVRFHPVEILLSMLIKLAVIAVLGANPLGVLVFEVLLNATSMFNHANVRLPGRLDAWLRWFVVTPAMHRVHHSIVRRETDSNFGFNAPWWDRLFGTYRAYPAAGYERMVIGIPEFRTRNELALGRMLLQPLRKDSGSEEVGCEGRG